MPHHRVIVHANFHKTGTVAVQNFHHNGGENVWPHFLLVLPGRRSVFTASVAVQYSLYGKTALLAAFGADLYASLSNIYAKRNGNILIS